MTSNLAERYAQVQTDNQRVLAANARLRSENGHLRQERDRLLELAAELRLGLETRILIEQAKGIIAARAGVPVEAAFELLRDYADTDGHHDLHVICAGVVATQEQARPDPEPRSAVGHAQHALALMAPSRTIRDHYDELAINGAIFE